MIVKQKVIEYQVGKYIISVETTGDKTEIFVQDENHNLLLSCLSFQEAEGISKALLEVVNKELDIANDDIPF